MKYTITPTKQYLSDIKKLNKKRKFDLLKKIDDFIDEIEENPRQGTGRVERLRHYNDHEVYSRSIDHEHRLVYEILEDDTIVILMAAYGHYGR